MWSLGCVTVILLTGASAFTDPVTQEYSPVLAKECNLHSLRQSRDWEAVRPRPKDFVERLLVLAEGQRMTAAQALEHEWFSNDFHKTNFEEVYQRAIKHWRSRLSRADIFEFSNASSARRIARAQGILPEKERYSGPKLGRVVESHHQPFPRQLHSSFLWPKRKPTPSYVAPETKAAMDNWPSANKEDEDQGEEDDEYSSTPGLSNAFSRRRRCFSQRSQAGSQAFSPSKVTVAPSSRFRKPLPPLRSASLPNTPQRKSSSLSASITVPLRLANANAKVIPKQQQENGSPTPYKLKRRSETRTSYGPEGKSQKRRRLSVYDFEEAGESVNMRSNERSKSDEQENEQDLDIPHHSSAVAESDSMCAGSGESPG